MYDIIIVGGGPAGLTAGLYAGRSKLKTLIIEKSLAGGQVSGTAFVENYPGSIEDASGMGLSNRMLEQSKEFAEIKYEDVVEVSLKGDVKKVKTDKAEYEAKVVIISSGASHRKLEIPGEEEFSSKGVSFCATCDGPFFTGLDIYVVGGGDSALEEASYLSRFAKSVTIIHRREEFRASAVVVDKVKNDPKIKFELNAIVKEIKGDKEAKSLLVENTKTREIKELKSKDGSPIGVFIFIGYIPQTDLFEGQVELKHGYIVTDEDMKTNLEGVFAVGDVRDKKVRQIVTAASDGAIAAVLANRYLEGLAW
ncbi:MAG: thioredoxin-disulfide reductase [Anaerococcus sp.]|nr:thioredoxin-disulfide reductase [Anaerococcus sp.]